MSLKDITVTVKVPGDTDFCENPSPVKGHPGFRCRFLVEPYWMWDYEAGTKRRFCKLFFNHVVLQMKPDGQPTWIKLEKCIKHCKEVTNE